MAINLKKNKCFLKNGSPQYVTVKIEDKEYSQQLSLMIKQAAQLQIVSESLEEIVLISKCPKQSIKDIFPKIKTIESELTLFETQKKRFKKRIRKVFTQSFKTERHLEIINISGIFMKKE